MRIAADAYNGGLRMETVKKNKNKIYLAIIVVAVIVMVVLLVDYKKNVPQSRVFPTSQLLITL